MQVGYVEKVTFDITQPISMQYVNIDLNLLTMLTGTNGSGKSFVMVNIFAMQTILGALFALGKNAPNHLKLSFAQDVYNKSFDNQNITGKIEFMYKSGIKLSVEFHEGHILSLENTSLDGYDGVTPVMYLSSNMRTFDAIKSYLMMRTLLNMTAGNLSREQVLNELLKKGSKLYDVMYIESLIAKMPVIDENLVKLKTQMKTFSEAGDLAFMDDIKEINIDLDKNDFYYLTSTTQKVYFCSLSKGIQALLNMTLATI